MRRRHESPDPPRRGGQRSLFDPQAQRTFEFGAGEATVLDHRQVLEPDERGQLRLFTPRNKMAQEIEHALARGDLAAAVAAHRRAVATYGGVAPDLEFLGRLPSSLLAPGTPAPASVLAAWDHLQGELGKHPFRLRQVRGILFGSALASEQRSRELGLDVAERVSLLYERGERELARAVVRDGLLRGEAVRADRLPDPALRELFDDAVTDPAWLASLGYLVPRLWSLDRPPTDLETSALAAAAPQEEAAKARAFWSCLRISDSLRAIPDELRQRARVRMRQLWPDGHAVYMRRVSGLPPV